ncbi:hypothetical protein VBJ55_22500 [Enterobacter hormaechei]|uniref:Uncharacterized protein n=4 Tax=root TaxID=1 RepID=A0A4D6DXV3_9CAUD|nr:hypothetical protein HOV36_gp36 [Salmonella phage ZCSE2]MEA4022403.1 hypothetical protein [Enterobacter hormaechei]QMV47874.1 hypothetical protein [Salmonella phage S144]UOK16635.1 hypothetical protein HBKIJOIA_00034 [Salmonella phage S1]WQZ00463.1 hypothetical protein AEV23_00019 [Klebsiella phage VB_KpM-AEV23]HBU2310268.1 hypothetical protein [Klebsiella pneumoniae]
MSEKLTFVSGKEEVNGVMYPAAGTGARFVWDLADQAHEAGESSSDVMDKVVAQTEMSRGTVSSQLTYWRKATGKVLAKRIDTAKAERDAAKAEEKRLKAEARAKAKAEKAEAKAAEQIRKAEEKAEKARQKAEAAKAEAAALAGGNTETDVDNDAE